MVVILAVDDDIHTLELISIYLSQSGYRVIKGINGKEGLDILEHELPDLAIIDVMMPIMDGFQLTKIIREQYNIPVLLLTAKGKLEDKEKGYIAGSDDYLVKPFEPKELLFRIRAILRRYDKTSDVNIRIGNMLINRKSFEVQVGEEVLVLPLKEFELLSKLASKPNQVFTRDQLIETVWGVDFEGDEQTLSVHIKRIRERLTKLETAIQITTVRGIGYKLEESI
ncbi:DNA-binding response regulator, OmpR family, contains REC and winged-helix (wHTH) domain [Paenisporosarcina quisquiliarum]|uniref:response regulator transcription factor n=1 Tax=Psychrobacillus psychrodurans TaxID=126157 RepID=UPI0008B9A12A|nr:response regulator transcription factor [Psychrobacillus psychrodurans]SEN91124.1 DNA-binding response regulator, OmpR family, contains REC and winged-helix (wHTH) domain [Paenisporosarcina quisquiliarum]SFM77684.1 DNA-binding response regulator, OmpR family, contains REC and winged-helix (wHTH) domain [Psychrobacillus psychrodurans]